MRCLSLTLFSFLLMLSVASAQKLVDKVVGIVDDKIILLSDLESQYQQYVQQYNEKPGKTYMCDVLNQLMTQKLLMAQALLDSVVVSDEEVETELDKRIRYFSNMTGGQSKLEEYYGKSIVEIKDEFRNEIKDQLLSSREQQSIISGIKVNPSEVKTYFNAQPKDSLPYYNSNVEVGVIVFYPKLSDELKNLAYQKISDLRVRAVKGEEFATLASIYSQDPGSMDKGGDLGFVDRGELDPAFEAAAFNLKNPGDISPIVESKFGYHIIQLMERRGEKIEVRHILIIPQTTSEDLAKALAHADSVKQLLDDHKISFPQAVNRYTEDETTRNSGGMLVNPNSSSTFFEIPDLGNFDKSLVFVTDSMKVGDISRPRVFKGKDGKTGYRIIYLKSETKPHKANMLNDYDKIEGAALIQKQTNVMNDWLADKIKVTFVQVDTNYVNCEAMKKWNQKKSKPNE